MNATMKNFQHLSQNTDLCQKFSFTADGHPSDPYLGGALEIEVSARGVKIRWQGEKEWKDIPWYEIMVCAGDPGRYKQQIQDAFDQAKMEGMNAGVTTRAKLSVMPSAQQEPEADKESA